MKNQPEPFPKLIPAGESALLVELADDVDLSINNQVYALDSWMRESVVKGVTHWVPGYSSLVIHFDPLLTNALIVQDWFLERWRSCPSVSER